MSDKAFEVGTSSSGAYVYADNFQVAYSAEVARMVASDLVPLGKQVGANGCLIDTQTTSHVSSTSEKYAFAYRSTESAGLPRDWKYAFVTNEGDESAAIIETMMSNAGFSFQIFTDKQEAIDWLTSE